MLPPPGDGERPPAPTPRNPAHSTSPGIVRRLDLRYRSTHYLLPRRRHAHTRAVSGASGGGLDRSSVGRGVVQAARDVADDEEYLAFLGPRVPNEVHEQLGKLKERIEANKN